MTYYNPLMDTFCYLIMQHLNEYPNVILFIFGLSYGLLTFISFKISELVMKTHKSPVLISILATLIGATAINSIYSTGRLAHDLIIAFFILCGIYFIFKSAQKNNLILIIISGLILGCACGFKYTTVPFA